MTTEKSCILGTGLFECHKGPIKRPVLGQKLLINAKVRIIDKVRLSALLKLGVNLNKRKRIFVINFGNFVIFVKKLTFLTLFFLITSQVLLSTQFKLAPSQKLLLVNRHPTHFLVSTSGNILPDQGQQSFAVNQSNLF